MSERHEKQDAYSGIPWVYVSPEEVRAHPKGRLSPTLWATGLFFIASGLAKGWVLAAGGAGTGLALLAGALPLLTGVGLLIRAPWALVLAVVSAGLTLFSLFRDIGGEAGLYYLAEALVMAGILFYLLDGDRPNFIYRHRFRKYSAVKEEP